MLAPGITLYLVRHGETDWNAEGRLQGGREIPLNDHGRKQAWAVGGKLRDLAVDADALPFISSPMGRAQASMELIRRSMGLEPQRYRIDTRLREITFGQWEALTWREVRARDAEGAAARERDKWHFVPPGGESYEMLEARVAPVFAEMASTSVVVSHGGVMRAALVALGLARPGEAENLDVLQGSIMVARRDGWTWF